METPRRVRGPWGLIVALALIGAIESNVARRDAYLSSQADDWKCKGWAATTVAVSSEILCLGDSVVEFGMHPSVLSRRVGPAYNLAVPAGSPESSLLLLRRALAAGAKPKAVVVDFPNYQLREDPYFAGCRKRVWPELATIRELLAVAIARRDAHFAATNLVAAVVPSVRARDEIRAAILANLAGKDTTLTSFATNITRKNAWINRGAMALAAGGRKGADADPQPGEYCQTERDPLKVATIRRFLQLAEAHQIRVIWLVPPISPEYQAISDRLGATAHYDEFLSAMAAAHPKLELVDARRSGFGPTLFVDGIHLNRDGSASLSEAVGSILAEPPPPTRWTSIPHARRGSTDSPIEDVDQTRTAIMMGLATARK